MRVAFASSEPIAALAAAPKPAMPSDILGSGPAALFLSATAGLGLQSVKAIRQNQSSDTFGAADLMRRNR